MNGKNVKALEKVLVDYVERFGLTPAARAYFSTPCSEMVEADTGGLSEYERALCLDRFGYLP